MNMYPPNENKAEPKIGPMKSPSPHTDVTYPMTISFYSGNEFALIEYIVVWMRPEEKPCTDLVINMPIMNQVFD